MYRTYWPLALVSNFWYIIYSRFIIPQVFRTDLNTSNGMNSFVTLVFIFDVFLFCNVCMVSDLKILGGLLLF